jgi:Fe2+ transport system protein FeoA
LRSAALGLSRSLRCCVSIRVGDAEFVGRAISSITDFKSMAAVQAPARTLADCKPGHFECLRVEAEGQTAIRLKRLGICEGRKIELLGRGDPMIVRLGEARVGLSRQLAQCVVIQTERDEHSVNEKSL